VWLAVLLAAPSVVVAAPRSAVSSPAGPDPIAAAPAGTTSWVVALKPGKDSTRLASPLSRGVGGQAGHVFGHALHGFVFKGSAKAADALRRNPNVRSIEADGPIHLMGDTIGSGVSRIKANHTTPPSAYAAGFMGDGVRVAILDTGIDLTHPDLVPNLDTSLGANCITAGPPQDGHGHGTHVAGIVAAADDNEGMIGVAPHARLVPFKVLDDTGQGEWSNLICAIDIITGYATDSDPSNDIQVANMSLGDVGGIGTCTDGFVREAICTSVAAGVTYVAAAGNSTTDAGTFIPAAMPEVISVSALTDLDGEPGGNGGCWLIFLFCDDTLAEYSNFGPSVDLTAPGTQITSDWTGGTYATEMGTSMAAPHVSGAAALLLAAFPGLTPADVMDQLRTTGQCPNGQLADADGTGSCVGKGQWGNDPDGIAEPLVNALNAVSGGIPGDRRPTVHVTSPAAGATVSGVVDVTASATDDNGVVKVDFLINGVQAATDANAADGWAFSWNTTGLDPGLDTITAKATDTAGQTSTSSVTVQVGANLQGTWVGQFGHDGYVLAGWNGGTTDLAALPAGVSYALDQGGRYQWAASTTDVRALQSPDQSQRRATTWFDKTSLQFHLTFANAYVGSLHLYAVDWDAFGGDRLQNVTIDDGHVVRTVQLASSFFNGGWVSAPINVTAGGTVRIRADWTGGETAVISGLFLGGAGAPPPPPPPPPPATVEIPGVQGNWTSSYGANGYALANWNGAGSDLTSLPAGATLTLEKGGRATWASTTTDVRALTNPTGTSRQSQTWYDQSQMRLRLTLPAGYSGNLHLYAVDWDAYGGNRYETITIDDGAGPRQAQVSTSFVNGAWIHAPIAVAPGGSVTVTVDKTGGYSAVLAGLFLGSPGPPPPTQMPFEIPGVQGSWLGTYGASGYVLANWNGNGTDLVSLPVGVTSTLEKGGRATWVSPTTDVRALISPTGTERRSQTWYDLNQMRVRLSFTNAFNGTIHLYAVDWDAYGGNRYENVTVDDGSGPKVAQLSTSFVQGAWMHAFVAVPPGGSVVVTIDKTGGYSAVLAGLFLDAAAGPVVPGAPTGVTATRGDSQVVLTWSAPASDGGSAITGYKVYRGTSSGGETLLTTVGNVTAFTDTGLTNGTTYW
jgi:subtilisin family serine protease